MLQIAEQLSLGDQGIIFCDAGLRHSRLGSAADMLKAGITVRQRSPLAHSGHVGLPHNAVRQREQPGPAMTSYPSWGVPFLRKTLREHVQIENRSQQLGNVRLWLVGEEGAGPASLGYCGLSGSRKRALRCQLMALP